MSTVHLRRRALVLGSAIAAGSLLAACSSTSSTTNGAAGSTTSAGTSAAATSGGGTATSGAPAASGGATGCAAYSSYGSLKGKTVTIYSSILSPESDSLEKSWSEFATCTGVKIQFTGSNDFESQLPVKVAGGNAPDLAIIPQPGLLQSMVKTGKAVEAPAAVLANVTKNWSAGWKGYATVNGKFYGAPMSANVKSLIWYSPSAFKAKGWTVPTTWADLMTLSQKIADTKETPWCGGIGSGTATGWPATDWLEELVLRDGGPDVYDKWISHAIKFDSPEIKSAMTLLDNWMRKPGWVYGGSKTVATTTFQNAGAPLVTGKCAMLQQASFYEAQWAKGTKIGPDGDIFAFYMPTIAGKFGLPVEGGGEFLTAFSNRPEVQAVQTYLSTSAWASSRVKVATGWVSANTGVDQALYTDPIDQLSAKFLTDPKVTFRFDASDLMPSAVGSGAEWKQFTAFFAENKSVDAVLKAIDSAWPTS
ncbi:MAG: alpha-glucoside transport system substrate-binding protein [Frankiales bacterium]|jgi:alpha-glucoside transport system substrate-binding protein|nr:alpha-glucoside transport system substrate-binding protein [Frankiales bacterium]